MAHKMQFAGRVIRKDDNTESKSQYLGDFAFYWLKF